MTGEGADVGILAGLLGAISAASRPLSGSISLVWWRILLSSGTKWRLRPIRRFRHLVPGHADLLDRAATVEDDEVVLGGVRVFEHELHWLPAFTVNWSIVNSSRSGMQPISIFCSPFCESNAASTALPVVGFVRAPLPSCARALLIRVLRRGSLPVARQVLRRERGADGIGEVGSGWLV